MTTNLPKKYSTNLPRVSEVVEWAFPFKNTEDESHFHYWLKEKGIDLLEYMKEASTGGTKVHKELEKFCNGNKVSCNGKYGKIIKNGILSIKELNIIPIQSEVYLYNKFVQGTCDLIGKIGKEKYVFDFKTYNLAKYKYGLQKDSYTKPYSKLKKASLQLSIYAHILGIKNIAVIELNKSGYYFHKLELIPKNEINKIIKEYYLNWIDEE